MPEINDSSLFTPRPVLLGLTRRRLLRRTAGAIGLWLGSGEVGQLRAADPAHAELPVTGNGDPRLVSFDRVMSSFMTLNKIPGAALAVTKDSRLVYARGFGYADLTRKEPIEPGSLFRIASISKPITAAAVLRLVEGGKVRLRDKVFDILKFASNVEPNDRSDPRLKEITVLQLLHHTAGWDSGKSPDPMVWQSAAIAKAQRVDPPARPEHIIRHMLGRPLDFDPGRRQAYSNFGYCLLGRVIEVVTGMTYEKYVRKEVLSLVGIKRMRVGKTLDTERVEGEVRYYDERGRTAPAVVGPHVGRQVPLPYGAWYLEAMDSHGGWIASAVDLVRFASEFDRPGRSKLVSASSIETMFARPEGHAGYESDGRPRSIYYGCGWYVVSHGNNGGQNHFHGGALDGSSGLLVRRGDGLNWAVVFNTCNGPAGNHLGFAIDLDLHRAADKVTAWPSDNRFESYL